MIGAVWDGPMVVGHTTTTQTTVGASELARLLAPPTAPYFPPNKSWAIPVGIVMLVGGLGLGIVSVPLTIILVGFFTGILALMMVVAGIAVVCVEGGNVTKRNQAALQYPAWEQAMSHWNMLFFCGRCGHVHNPQTRQCAPSVQMYTLL